MRLHIVNSARIPYRCQKCGKPIEPKTAYCWFKPRYGGKRTFHNTPECRPSAAERETNDKRAAQMRAAEAVDKSRESYGDPSEAAAHLQEAIEHAQECVELLQEGSSNLDLYFSNSELKEAFDNDAAELEDWISDMESVTQTLESIEIPDEPDSEPDPPSRDDYTDEDAYDEAHMLYLDDMAQWQAATSDYEDTLSELQTAIDNITDVPELTF